MPVIAGGGDSGVLQHQDGMGGAVPVIGCFDGDAPGAPVGAQPQCAQFPVDPHQAVRDPEPEKRLGQPVDAVALGDPVEVQCQRRTLAHGGRADLDRVSGCCAPAVHGGADRVRRGVCRAEAPGRDRVAKTHVKGAARLLPDL